MYEWSEKFWRFRLHVPTYCADSNAPLFIHTEMKFAFLTLASGSLVAEGCYADDTSVDGCQFWLRIFERALSQALSFRKLNIYYRIVFLPFGPFILQSRTEVWNWMDLTVFIKINAAEFNYLFARGVKAESKVLN